MYWKKWKRKSVKKDDGMGNAGKKEGEKGIAARGKGKRKEGDIEKKGGGIKFYARKKKEGKGKSG